MLVTGSIPFPFMTKEGSLEAFKTVSAGNFSSDFSYGQIISGTYPYKTSISSDYYREYTGNNIRSALKNTLNHYSTISPHYLYESSYGDKGVEEFKLISIPSIFYGQSIKKGSVDLKYYVTGTLVGHLKDSKRNGELVQVGPKGSNGSGSIAGIVLYKEGFLYLSGSWSLKDDYTEMYDVDSIDQYNPSWLWFMATGSETSSPPRYFSSSSYGLDFQATETIPTLTMFAKAGRGEFNHSNNTTAIGHGQNIEAFITSSVYEEPQDLVLENMSNGNYADEEPLFEKITYISKIALYDEKKNLIGVAKVAQPVRKNQNENIAFKLKLDM